MGEQWANIRAVYGTNLILACMDCCDPNGLNRIFGGRLVRQELRAYKRRGPNARQRDILVQLGPLVPDASALDVGCGVGAVGVSLLTRGAADVTFIDVSAAYLRAARELVAEAGVGERASFDQADFAVSERQYPQADIQADIVVLDRVVCCYPNATALLEKAARHSRKTLVFTYPRPFWFMPLFRTLCAWGMRLFGQKYRFFLHNPEQLLKAATAAGHVQVVTHPLGMWQLVKVTKPGR